MVKYHEKMWDKISHDLTKFIETEIKKDQREIQRMKGPDKNRTNECKAMSKDMSSQIKLMLSNKSVIHLQR